MPPRLPVQRSSLPHDSTPAAPDPAEKPRCSPVRGPFTSTPPLPVQGSAWTTNNVVFRPKISKPNPPSLLLTHGALFSSYLHDRIAVQQKAFGSSVYGSIIRSIENNFAGLDDIPIGIILKYLKQEFAMRSRLLQYRRVIPKDVSRALAENTVRAAIENGDTATVTECLSTGLLIPDEIVCTINGRRYTAAERSAMLQSYEVTEVLVNAHADVNKTHETNPDVDRGSLELALTKRGKPALVHMRLLNLLLDCGAEVRPGLIMAAIERRDTNLVRRLLSKFSHLKHQAAVTNSSAFMVGVVELLDCETATVLVSQIVRDCFEKSSHEWLAFQSTVLRHPLITAARKGYLELVCFLDRHVTDKGGVLASAVRGGQRDIIEHLLMKGVSVDSPADLIQDRQESSENHLTTPLAEAIRANSEELTYEFERRGALSQINEQGRFRAAIYAASKVGNLSYVEKLIQMAPGMGESMTSALTVSITKGHDEIAMTLIKAGADVNWCTESYDTRLPLSAALDRRNRDLVYAILERDQANSPSYTTFLIQAIEWGEDSVVYDLLSMAADSSSPGVIHAAVMAKNKKVVTYLVEEYGAYLAGCTLESAVTSKDMDVLRHLLSLGADPTASLAIDRAAVENRDFLAVLLRAFRVRYPKGKKGFGARALEYALDCALGKNDSGLLNELLKAKFDVNAMVGITDRTSILGTAICKFGACNLKIIRKLLRAGGDPNRIARRAGYDSSADVWPQYTPLLLAVRTKNVALVELLIDAGADIFRPARLGVKRTPLQCACEVGSMDIVELLLRKGAQVNEPLAIRAGGTSLQLCAMGGHIGIAHRLLQDGADIHAAPSEVHGRTALEGAAEHGRLDMVNLLWDASVSKGFSWEECERGMKLAKENGHVACRNVLWELCLSDPKLMIPALCNA